MKLYIISLIFINIIFSIFPNQSNIADNFNNSYADDINSNSIYEIIELEGRLWLRTGSGFSFIDYNNSNNITTSNNNSHNTTNVQNNIQQNITKNITINNFGKETTNHISKKFLDSLICAPFAAIPKLTHAIHFDPNHPENDNVRITNRKDNYIDVHI